MIKKCWQEMDTNHKNSVLVKKVLLFGRHGPKSFPKVVKVPSEKTFFLVASSFNWHKITISDYHLN